MKELLKFDTLINNLGECVSPVDFTFEANNISGNQLMIEVLPSCGCTKVEHNNPIEPNGKLKITGVFSRTSKSTYTKTMRVLVNPTIVRKNNIDTRVGEQEILLTLKAKLI